MNVYMYAYMYVFKFHLHSEEFLKVVPYLVTGKVLSYANTYSILVLTLN